MDIHEVNEAEMPAMWTLWVRALHDHPQAFGAPYEWARGVTDEQSRDLLRNIVAGEGFLLGAWVEDAPVGMLHFSRQQGEKFRHKGEIGAVYVMPEQRGGGIAKALIQAAVGRARTVAGMAVIGLSVNSENTAAIKTYEACGFTRYGVEPKGMRVEGQDIDLLHMTLII
ncbi:MAG: GNAT family N-acetyltransferase [Chloroflexi bacterium]|nr:GNAT family N-acetyltransferase [Chloroflexota bacterium]MCC6894984.1 GNAT family N-acetyltransferase [Anaerolineae bacterium]